jgi:hypothetical protein
VTECPGSTEQEDALVSKGCPLAHFQENDFSSRIEEQ